MKSKYQRVKLNDGHSIPVLGFGTAVLPEFPKTEFKKLLKVAIDAGFHHFDSASVYGSEDCVGEVIRSKIAEGTVRREDMFYTSKVWCNCLHPELVRSSLEQSLNKVQLDYVNLYLIHQPMALKATEKCKDAGLTRSIGVSNINRRQLEKILNKPGLKYKPVCNQVGDL
ncbi:aldo-keto reductase family 1 member C21-like [Sigmodon hispidus]